MSTQIHVGDYIFDGTAKFKVKRIGHTKLIGQIIWFSGTTIPENYLLCDGSQLNRDTYVELFEVIGTTYGSGNGYNTFNIPLLIDNKFIEGSTIAGTIKSAGLPNIKGHIYSYTHEICLADAEGLETTGPFGFETAKHPTIVGEVQNGGNAVPSGQHTSTFTFDAAKANSTYGRSNSVQPYSISLLPLIKYI